MVCPSNLLHDDNTKMQHDYNLIRSKALVRVLCDIQPTKTANAVYLNAQTNDNSKSVLLAAKFLFNKNLINEIILLDTKQHQGYSGYADWKDKLIHLGISEKHITGAKLDAPLIHNTLSESQAFVRLSKLKRHRCINLCASPFHQLRAFMTAVHVLKQEMPKLKVFSYPGIPLPWVHFVKHSQGNLTARRDDLIESEFLRIEKYHRLGNLISIKQLVKYLDDRDEIN